MPPTSLPPEHPQLLSQTTFNTLRLGRNDSFEDLRTYRKDLQASANDTNRLLENHHITIHTYNVRIATLIRRLEEKRSAILESDSRNHQSFYTSMQNIRSQLKQCPEVERKKMEAVLEADEEESEGDRELFVDEVRRIVLKLQNSGTFEMLGLASGSSKHEWIAQSSRDDGKRPSGAEMVQTTQGAVLSGSGGDAAAVEPNEGSAVQEGSEEGIKESQPKGDDTAGPAEGASSAPQRFGSAAASGEKGAIAGEATAVSRLPDRGSARPFSEPVKRSENTATSSRPGKVSFPPRARTSKQLPGVKKNENTATTPPPRKLPLAPSRRTSGQPGMKDSGNARGPSPSEKALPAPDAGRIGQPSGLNKNENTAVTPIGKLSQSLKGGALGQLLGLKKNENTATPSRLRRVLPQPRVGISGQPPGPKKDENITASPPSKKAPPPSEGEISMHPPRVKQSEKTATPSQPGKELSSLERKASGQPSGPQKNESTAAPSLVGRSLTLLKGNIPGRPSGLKKNENTTTPLGKALSAPTGVRPEKSPGLSKTENTVAPPATREESPPPKGGTSTQPSGLEGGENAPPSPSGKTPPLPKGGKPGQPPGVGDGGDGASPSSSGRAPLPEGGKPGQPSGLKKTVAAPPTRKAPPQPKGGASRQSPGLNRSENTAAPSQPGKVPPSPKIGTSGQQSGLKKDGNATTPSPSGKAPPTSKRAVSMPSAGVKQINSEATSSQPGKVSPSPRGEASAQPSGLRRDESTTALPPTGKSRLPIRGATPGQPSGLGRNESTAALPPGGKSRLPIRGATPGKPSGLKKNENTVSPPSPGNTPSARKGVRPGQPSPVGKVPPSPSGRTSGRPPGAKKSENTTTPSPSVEKSPSAKEDSSTSSSLEGSPPKEQEIDSHGVRLLASNLSPEQQPEQKEELEGPLSTPPRPSSGSEDDDQDGPRRSLGNQEHHPPEQPEKEHSQVGLESEGSNISAQICNDDFGAPGYVPQEGPDSLEDFKETQTETGETDAEDEDGPEALGPARQEDMRPRPTLRPSVPQQYIIDSLRDREEITESQENSPQDSERPLPGMGEPRTNRMSRYFWRVQPGAPPYQGYEVPNLQTIEEQSEGSSEPDIEQEKPETSNEQELTESNEDRQNISAEVITDSPSGEDPSISVSNIRIPTWDIRLRTELVEQGRRGERSYIPLRRLPPPPSLDQEGYAKYWQETEEEVGGTIDSIKAYHPALQDAVAEETSEAVMSEFDIVMAEIENAGMEGERRKPENKELLILRWALDKRNKEYRGETGEKEGIGLEQVEENKTKGKGHQHQHIKEMVEVEKQNIEEYKAKDGEHKRPYIQKAIEAEETVIEEHEDKGDEHRDLNSDETVGKEEQPKNSEGRTPGQEFERRMGQMESEAQTPGGAKEGLVAVAPSLGLELEERREKSGEAPPPQIARDAVPILSGRPSSGVPKGGSKGGVMTSPQLNLSTDSGDLTRQSEAQRLEDEHQRRRAVILEESRRNQERWARAERELSAEQARNKARIREMVASQIAAEDTTERDEASMSAIRKMVQESEDAAKKRAGILERSRAWRRLAGERKREQERKQLENKPETKPEKEKEFRGKSEEDERHEEEPEEQQSTYLESMGNEDVVSSGGTIRPFSRPLRQRQITWTPGERSIDRTEE